MKVGAKAIVAVVLGGMSSASADVVHFLNSDEEFVWWPHLMLENGEIQDGTFFHPTVSAANNASSSNGEPVLGPAISYLRVLPQGAEDVAYGSIQSQSAAVSMTNPVHVGELIDASGEFADELIVDGFSHHAGAFPLFGNQMILGLTIQLEGEAHYGWARFAWSSQPLFGEVFTMYRPVEWAYESEPGVPITVIPSPASALSMGAFGLLTLRRRR